MKNSSKTYACIRNYSVNRFYLAMKAKKSKVKFKKKSLGSTRL